MDIRYTFPDDTQMIVGGERENTLTPEEYIAGAIMLYLDIILTFIYILQILMACEDWNSIQ